MSVELLASIFHLGVFVLMVVLYLQAQSRADKEKGRADAAFSALDSLLATHQIKRVVITRTTQTDHESTDMEESN